MSDARGLARRLVAEEIEDVLTVQYREDESGTPIQPPIPPGYVQVLKESHETGSGHVLIETAALAAEAIIRLAHVRNEDRSKC